MTFSSSNPDFITYDHSDLRYTVLGGIRFDTLDRLRVTLKIDFKELSIRHNLDLYNDSQVDKFMRKCAERFSLGVSYMTKATNALTGKLEEYRMETTKKLDAEAETIPVKQLSEAEKQSAMELLQSGDLLKNTNVLISSSGVVSEEINRMIMYLVFTSRKMEYPLHIITLGSSGIGKTYLQEKIGELIPEEELIEITTLSENALYYFGQKELKGKVVSIEDLDGAESSLYPLRELMSKRHITKTVAIKDARGDTKTLRLKVEGPLTVSGCTTQENIYEDNANRCLLIQVDSSTAQDARIMDYQRKVSAGKINRKQEQSAKELLKNCQRLLEPIRIRNPYAESLLIPQEVFKPRRTNAHYLRFIEAITFYKQHQREKKTEPESGEIYIETTLEDIREANELIKDVLIRKSDVLPSATRDYFELLKLNLGEEGEKSFTSKEVSISMRIPITTIKRYHLQLLNGGFLKTQAKKKGERFLRYEVTDAEEYKKLEECINSVLDEALKKIEGE